MFPEMSPDMSPATSPGMSSDDEKFCRQVAKVSHARKLPTPRRVRIAKMLKVKEEPRRPLGQP